MIKILWYDVDLEKEKILHDDDVSMGRRMDGKC